jgi:hypothetical protein
MEKLLEDMLNALRDALGKEIYTAFDAVPLQNKNERFTVLGLEAVHFDAPFPAAEGACYPFTADFRVTVYAPMLTGAAVCENYFFNTVIPVMLEAGCSHMESSTAAADVRLQKISYSGVFRLCGIYLMDLREEEDT